jgi:D-glycero-D-manno-heptose 1,7-bisphosphate phosphatase
LSTTADVPHPRKPAVFLDRDGVLNEVTLRDGRPHPPPSAGELRLLPGVEAACRRLHDWGYALVVITNQPDIARGQQTRHEVDQMHTYLRGRLPLDDIVVCPHDDSDGCLCRKPQPGMILDAAARLDLDLPTSFCVGDRWRDIEAARRAGVRAIHVERHYDERPASGAEATVSGLPEAVDFIASHRELKEINR